MSDNNENMKDATPETDSAMPDSAVLPPDEIEALGEGEREADKSAAVNQYFHSMVDRNFLEYASYVIKDRAIPDVDDGLKPVQRRILWAMHKVDDGRTHKAAFVVGEVMGKYHPHGDASIKDALVVLANKEYFIEKQGNFGNIITGSAAAASRYIECGLAPLAREVLFNDDITELVDTYDGRHMEPVVLPVKIPSLLMLGADGIAVGMATKIMPHNFCELLEAQIAVLENRPFELYPDFLQGGLMDVSEYNDGNGKITLRAKIELDGRRLIIREIPASTTTESLIASIEKAAEKGKIKIASVNDYTAKEVEIEIVPMRGYDPQKALQALYMYTDCAVTISANLTVIRENRPAVMSVTGVIHRNTEKLLEYLQRELEIALNRQNELFHAKTLAQIFFENRIYKRIEECKSQEEEYAEVHAGLAPFRELVRRDITNDDIDKLLALPVRRISRFDIEKNQQELREIERKIAEIRHNLKNLTDYAKNYLTDLLNRYGANFPRRTEIEKLEKIDRKAAALSNIKVGWDRKNCYIGTQVKSEDSVMVSEFDQLLCVQRSGRYKIINIPDKIFIDRLYEFRKQDSELDFGVIYKDQKSGKFYGKRSIISKFITDREYMLCPEKCRLELLTPRADAIYQLKFDGRKPPVEINLMELPQRSPKARGILIGNNISKITFVRYLTEEELEELKKRAATEEINDSDDESGTDGTATQEIDDTVAETSEDGGEEQTQEMENSAAESPDRDDADSAEIPDAEAAADAEASEDSKVPETSEPAPEETDAAEPVPAVPETSDPVPDETDAADAVPETTEPEPAENRAEGEGNELISEPGSLLDAPAPEPEKRRRVRRTAKFGKGETTPPASAGNAESEEKSSAGKDDDHDDNDFGIIQPEFGF